MNQARKVDLSAIERELQEAFTPREIAGFTSTTKDLDQSELIGKLALPRTARGHVPLTRDKFVVNENPARIDWERHVREFLCELNSDFGHRVSAPMIFEWTTGISIAELVEREKAAKLAELKQEAVDNGEDPDQVVLNISTAGGAGNGSANMHLRHINWVLREYFGKSYKTKIAGREVGKAYTVRPAFRVRQQRPANLSLWVDWKDGTLDPKPKPARGRRKS